MINLKKLAHKKFKISALQSDYLKFSNLFKECKALTLHCSSNYILKIENNILNNIKPFWNYIKSFNKFSILENMS